MHIVDTHVISEPRRTKPHEAVASWLRAQRPSKIAVPCIVIAESQNGAEFTRKQYPVKAAAIDARLKGEITKYVDLPVDGLMYRKWGHLIARKSDDLSSDAPTAAAARIQAKVVTTRNAGDFEAFDLQVFNPFEFRSGDR
jgi:predicted nucleic acid-binding protein